MVTPEFSQETNALFYTLKQFNGIVALAGGEPRLLGTHQVTAFIEQAVALTTSLSLPLNIGA